MVYVFFNLKSEVALKDDLSTIFIYHPHDIPRHQHHRKLSHYGLHYIPIRIKLKFVAHKRTTINSNVNRTRSSNTYMPLPECKC